MIVAARGALMFTVVKAAVVIAETAADPEGPTVGVTVVAEVETGKLQLGLMQLMVQWLQ
jgi:hypothetical protein